MKQPNHASDLFRILAESGTMPLEPTDEYYVPLLEDTPSKDPILRLMTRILGASSESVHLLTGFRGNGKSTQLYRLQALLREEQCEVFFIDMIDYVSMTKPIELSDFLLSFLAALSVEVAKSTHTDPAAEGYAERFWKVLRSEVGVKDVDLGVEVGAGPAKLGAKIGMRLKTEESFKRMVQDALRGRETRLVEQAGEFVSQIVDSIRRSTQDPNRRVVVLLDSLEQIRGVGLEAQTLYASIVELFSGQAQNLRFPQIHVVYTVPPYLLSLAPNLGAMHGGSALTVWPNVHVRFKDGTADPSGLALMREIVSKRYPAWQNVLASPQLDRLASASGGDLRDFFRLVREASLSLHLSHRADPGAVMDDGMLRYVEQALRNELMPAAQDDALWLSRIHATKDQSLPSVDQLPSLARFFDSNWIMNYENGETWYDIHPLLVPEVEKLAAQGGRSKSSR